MNGDAADPRRARLVQARMISGALTAGVLLLFGASGWIDLGIRSTVLVLPAGLLGLVSPVIGYRLYHLIGDRIPSAAGEESRCAAFVTANVAALAVTKAAAFFGLVAYVMSGAPLALAGVLTHVILAGALWPTPERLEIFLDASGP